MHFYNAHNISWIKTCEHFINKNKYLYSEYILKAFLIIKVHFQHILENTALMVKNYVLEQVAATFSCRPSQIHYLLLTEGKGGKSVIGTEYDHKD